MREKIESGAIFSPDFSILSPKSRNQALDEIAAAPSFLTRIREAGPEVERVGRRELHQPRESREGRPAVSLRQPRHLRPADPHRPAEHALGIIGDRLQLGAAADEGDLRSGLGSPAGGPEKGGDGWIQRLIAAFRTQY